jgi:hypothetical protein
MRQDIHLKVNSSTSDAKQLCTLPASAFRAQKHIFNTKQTAAPPKEHNRGIPWPDIHQGYPVLCIDNDNAFSKTL